MAWVSPTSVRRQSRAPKVQSRSLSFELPKPKGYPKRMKTSKRGYRDLACGVTRHKAFGHVASSRTRTASKALKTPSCPRGPVMNMMSRLHALVEDGYHPTHAEYSQAVTMSPKRRPSMQVGPISVSQDSRSCSRVH